MQTSWGPYYTGYSQSGLNYDSANRWIEIVRQHNVNGVDQHWRSTFSFDRLGRLTRAGQENPNGDHNWAGEWEVPYSYDRYGNMLTMNEPPAPGEPLMWSTQFNVDAATNRLAGYTKADRWGTTGTLAYTYGGANVRRSLAGSKGHRKGGDYDVLNRGTAVVAAACRMATGTFKA